MEPRRKTHQHSHRQPRPVSTTFAWCGLVAVALLTISVSLANAAGKQKQGSNTLHVQTVQDTQAFFHYHKNHATLISGHRGGNALGFPENSIPLFEHTLSLTPAIFEIDPHLTSNDKIVVMHDPTLQRTTTGQGDVRQHTDAEIKQLFMKDYKGNVTAFHPSTLDEVIDWAAGKTILNLDIKDVPANRRLEIVRKHSAWAYVLFTVHSAQEAKEIYSMDHRSLFAAVTFTDADIHSYEAAGIPWANIVIGYVGSKDKPENSSLYDTLHSHGIMAMVAAAPTYDKLPTEQERAEAYRQIVAHGADVIESDLPIEVAQALAPIKAHQQPESKFWHTSR
jgi:glycerophosphoryl diester phosphodiesterase